MWICWVNNFFFFFVALTLFIQMSAAIKLTGQKLSNFFKKFEIQIFIAIFG